MSGRKSATIPADLHKPLKTAAAELEISQQEVVARALRAFLQVQQTAAPAPADPLSRLSPADRAFLTDLLELTQRDDWVRPTVELWIRRARRNIRP